MSKSIFITGTGTDVGKTYVTGLIVKKLHDEGFSAGYYKAAMSGNEYGADGDLIPGDAMKVKSMSEIEQPLEEMCHYIYENAYSPHLASRIEGNPVEMSVVKAGYEWVASKYDYVVVEGSGGILCPIRIDEEEIFLEDVIKELGLNSLLIADAGLGTINSVVLTYEYMKAHDLPVKGIIFNNWHDTEMEQDNLLMCEKMTGLKVIAKVKPNDTELDIDIDVLKSLYE